MKRDINEKLFATCNDRNLLSNSSYNSLLKLLANDMHILKKMETSKKMENKKMENKKISVIVPTYNRANQLVECVNSILNQNYKNIEVIIIDDCSKDKTHELFSSYPDNRVRYYLNDRNMGVGANRNKGYCLSNGDYIIFCDDDDYYFDNAYFSNIIKIFENESINVICANSFIHYEKEDTFEINELNFNGNILSLEYLEKFQFKYTKPNSTFCAAFRKKCLEDAKFSNMKMMNDTSIYLRALMLGGECYGYKNIVGIYRVHEKNFDSKPIKSDFIIQNFKEKQYIYNYVKEKYSLNKIHFWYSKQISITANYFFSRKNDKEDVKIVLEWIRKNISYNLYLKFKIKNVLISKGLYHAN